MKIHAMQLAGFSISKWNFVPRGFCCIEIQQASYLVKLDYAMECRDYVCIGYNFELSFAHWLNFLFFTQFNILFCLVLLDFAAGLLLVVDSSALRN